MGDLFSILSSGSNSGSVPKELKDYTIKNPTIDKLRTMTMNCTGLLIFTDGDKNPELSYRKKAVEEAMKNANNN